MTLRRLETMDSDSSPPLSWRVWLLVPLLAISLLGIVVPLWRVHGAPMVRQAQRENLPPEKRAPYNDELMTLLDTPPDVPLSPAELSMIHRKHLQLQKVANAHEGTVPESEHKTLQALLKRFRNR